MSKKHEFSELQSPLVFGSEEAIGKMMPTHNMGGVKDLSREELSFMQTGSYVLRASGGNLTKVPAEKVLLPHDPVGHPQRVHAVMASDGTVYFSQGSIVSKSIDGGKTWDSHELTLGASPNCSFQILKDGTFVGVEATGDDLASVAVLVSDDEGRSWDKLSEVDNPSGCLVRYPGTICRLSDDTLLLPIESRYGSSNPSYVHRSIDGGKTWSGPTGPYSKPKFVDTHWVGPNTGPWFLGACCHEVMIDQMISGKLLAVIRYHGSVVPQWPLIDPGQQTFYKTVFLADSEDGGKTWKNMRPLTNVHGQCHGFGASLSDGTVVVTHDHRYSPGIPSGRAMVSHDEGGKWEDEVYYLYHGGSRRSGSGFSESVILEDDTILTIAATSEQDDEKGQEWDDYIGHANVWAIRWRLEGSVYDLP